jgi:hypothetical protein
MQATTQLLHSVLKPVALEKDIHHADDKVMEYDIPDKDNLSDLSELTSLSSDEDEEDEDDSKQGERSIQTEDIVMKEETEKGEEKEGESLQTDITDEMEEDATGDFMAEIKENLDKARKYSAYLAEHEEEERLPMDLDRPGVSGEDHSMRIPAFKLKGKKTTAFERTGVTHLVHSWHETGHKTRNVRCYTFSK